MSAREIPFFGASSKLTRNYVARKVTNTRSDFLCLTDATKTGGSLYLTKKGFNKILDDRSTFVVFSRVYYLELQNLVKFRLEPNYKGPK